jgi:putative FmdB family regulatory protein
MPTYKYRCTKCGEEFELWQSIHDDALTRHPGCGGTVTKVFAPAGIVLKGSGFYRTDSRAAANASGKSKDKEPAKGGAGGDGKGSDAKGAKESTGSKESSGDSKASKDSKTSKSGSSSS